MQHGLLSSISLRFIYLIKNLSACTTHVDCKKRYIKNIVTCLMVEMSKRGKQCLIMLTMCLIFKIEDQNPDQFVIIKNEFDIGF